MKFQRAGKRGQVMFEYILMLSLIMAIVITLETVVGKMFRASLKKQAQALVLPFP